jgi:hypothetical protein
VTACLCFLTAVVVSLVVLYRAVISLVFVLLDSRLMRSLHEQSFQSLPVGDNSCAELLHIFIVRLGLL